MVMTVVADARKGEGRVIIYTPLASKAAAAAAAVAQVSIDRAFRGC